MRLFIVIMLGLASCLCGFGTQYFANLPIVLILLGVLFCIFVTGYTRQLNDYFEEKRYGRG